MGLIWVKTSLMHAWPWDSYSARDVSPEPGRFLGALEDSPDKGACLGKSLAPPGWRRRLHGGGSVGGSGPAL